MRSTSAKGVWPAFEARIADFVRANASGLRVDATSESMIMEEMEDSVLGDLARVDGVALPFALLALATCLRSFRMLLIAAAMIGITAPYFFGIMYPVSLAIQISSFAPECASACIMALSVDYSLFIGSRFNERTRMAVLDGRDIRDEAVQLEVVRDMTRLVAHNIIVSGVAVGVALGGLVLVPLKLISTIGIAFFVGSLTAVVVAMTLLPAILLGWFEFFAHDTGFAAVCKAVPCIARFFVDDMNDDDDDSAVGALLEARQQRGIINRSGSATGAIGANDGDDRDDESRAVAMTPMALCPADDAQQQQQQQGAPAALYLPPAAARLRESADVDDGENENDKKGDEGNGARGRQNEGEHECRERLAHSINDDDSAQMDDDTRAATRPPRQLRGPGAAKAAGASTAAAAAAAGSPLAQSLLAPPAAAPGTPSLHAKRSAAGDATDSLERLAAPREASAAAVRAASSPLSPTLSHLSATSYEETLGPAAARRHQIARRAQSRSFWFRVGTYAVDNSCLVVTVFLLLLIPFAVGVAKLDVSFDLFSQVPRDSAKVKILDTVLRRIGTGALSAPFFVTVDTGRPGGLGARISPNISLASLQSLDQLSRLASGADGGFNQTAFQVLQQLVVYIAGRTGVPLDRVTSYVSFSGAGLGFQAVEADALMACAALGATLLNSTAAAGGDDGEEDRAKYAAVIRGCDEYAALVNRTVDPTYQVALLILAPPFDTFGRKANSYLNLLNDALAEFDNQGLFEVGFFGASAVDWQVMRSMLGVMPLQLGVTLTIIFVIVAIVFRSIAIPVRMIATVAYTVTIAFGTSVFLFQGPGVRDVWGANAPHAFVWLIPVFAFSLLCALALDYDVFLVSRVVEYRHLGFGTSAACRKAVWRTGRVISFAGAIMCISFGSMLFSQTMMLQQFGFVASVAVLIDTFLIRPLLVPALMTFRVPDACCWYPLVFEDGERDVDDMTESAA